MRTGFLLVFVTFLAALFYELWHLWILTPGGWPAKLALTGAFVLWMLLFFVGFGFTEKVPVSSATVLYEVGHPWMIAFLYLLLIFILADLARLFHLLPAMRNSGGGLAAVLGLVALLMIGGSVHYRHKYREEITIQTDKAIDKPLTIVLASDLHLGYHNRRADLARWVDLFNAEQPDLVLIGGDILDRSARPLLEGDYAAEFHRLSAPVWTVLGNHEYYSGEKRADAFFRAAGIRLLRDSVCCFQGVRVIGRDDRTNPHRHPLADLLRWGSPSDSMRASSPQALGADVSDTAGFSNRELDELSVSGGEKQAFSILLDHQPYHLEEAEQAGIDFQFSGHTHHGQVWPISWITDLMYEKAWGHHRRGNTRYYISSGLGIWGPKIRIGTRSEYLVLHIHPTTPSEP